MKCWRSGERKVCVTSVCLISISVCELEIGGERARVTSLPPQLVHDEDKTQNGECSRGRVNLGVEEGREDGFDGERGGVRSIEGVVA